eukprot:Trichotokara_eunicae@DN4638_c0_g1_i6.p1
MNHNSECAIRGQRAIRTVLHENYKDEKYHTDDPNGELAAFYVLSAMGIYPLLPGNDRYVLSTPLFRSLDVQFGANILHIEADYNCKCCYRSERVSWNGRELDEWSIGHNQLLLGGTLDFQMLEDAFIENCIEGFDSSSVALGGALIAAILTLFH